MKNMKLSALLREYRAGLPFYLVEWSGDYEDTWEPEANLVNAVGSVKKFNDALKVASDLAKEKIKLREEKKVTTQQWLNYHRMFAG